MQPTNLVFSAQPIPPDLLLHPRILPCIPSSHQKPAYTCFLLYFPSVDLNDKTLRWYISSLSLASRSPRLAIEASLFRLPFQKIFQPPLSYLRYIPVRLFNRQPTPTNLESCLDSQSSFRIRPLFFRHTPSLSFFGPSQRLYLPAFRTSSSLPAKRLGGLRGPHLQARSLPSLPSLPSLHSP